MKPEPSNPEPLPLSLLNDFLYCPRRAALKTIAKLAIKLESEYILKP